MFSRMCVHLIAPALFATIAVAQDTAAPAVEPTPAAVAVIGPPWDTIVAPLIERRYKVEAIRFKARDESGFDWWGSDEVMVGTEDAKGLTVSDEIGDINSGDTHEFDPAVSCIIGVRPGTVVLGKSSVCEAAGEPGPFSFKVEMWEKGWERFGGFNILPPAGPGRHAGPHPVDDGNGDDFIGELELFFPIPDLETSLPNVGDSFTETVVLDPCPGAACAGVPYYSFTYRTTRLADARTDFRSQLLAAMERSHITNAGDAIAAGLRSLAPPVDRQAEPEPGRVLAQE